MTKKVAFIFPGQGCQAVGMGKQFYDTYPVARELFQKGNEILGRDLTTIMFEGPEESLLQTRNCQCAIYINSMAILQVLKEQFPNLAPTVCAGHSLGEYSALTASGRMGVEQCLPLVQLRADAMNEACLTQPGKMAAILGLQAAQIEEIVGEVEGLWAANDNCPGQFVISGTEAGVARGMELAKERGAKRAILLPVHGAFHSGLMQQAQDKLEKALLRAAFTPSATPFVMNVTGEVEKDLGKMRKNLICQVTSSVRWQSCVAAMSDVDLFIEIGGNVLTGMNRKMGLGEKTLSLASLSDLETLTKAINDATS